MTRILLPLSGLLAILVACSNDEPVAQVASSSSSYTTPVASDWVPTVTEVLHTAASDVPDEIEPVVDAIAVDEVAPLPPGRWFSLRRGETLAHFARWSELPVEDIAEWSELDLSGQYAVGTEVFLPLTGESLSIVERARTAHRDVRVDGYLAMRGGSVGNTFYSVRTGDTVWGIAQENQAIPVWLVEAYNPSVNLDTVRPGDELMLPVLSDTVVDAAPDTLD